jgi:hypothetical protein
MVDRRAFLCGTVAILTAPLATEAQQTGTVPRIGVLSNGRPTVRPRSRRTSRVC